MSAQQTPWRLACFDLDGTLVFGTSTCLHLAAQLGHLELLTQLESQYAKGEISNAQVADGDGPYYKGQTVATIAAHLDTIPIIDGVASVVATLIKLGIESLICTVTWQFAAQVLAKRYGFVSASGVAMHVDDKGVLTGQVAKYFDEYDKLAFVKAYCEGKRIPLSSVFAVGDSRSDIPLFGAVGFSVAINATAAAKAAASTSIQTNDLNDVLALVPGLMRR